MSTNLQFRKNVGRAPFPIRIVYVCSDECLLRLIDAENQKLAELNTCIHDCFTCAQRRTSRNEIQAKLSFFLNEAKRRNLSINLPSFLPDNTQVTEQTMKFGGIFSIQ